MAGRWRIRHKLLVGLGLVVGVMAVLLAVTVEGLYSYRASINCVAGKTSELAVAQEFKEAIIELALFDPEPDKDIQRRNLMGKIEKAKKKLAAYRDALQDTYNRGWSLHPEFQNQGLVDRVEMKFPMLSQKIDQVFDKVEVNLTGGTAELPLRQQEEVKPVIQGLVQDAKDLEKGIYDDLYDIKAKAHSEYQRSFWFVGTTSIFSLLLMAGLLRVFYNWVFHPVRDLMQGVGRVARGDFDHGIDVRSGDEMQDLAAAFNDMTGRLRDMYRDLARQVNERSRQLVRSERLASVGFLAAGVAHEINNPLASIAFCSEALEGRLTELLPPGPRLPSRGSQAEVIFKYLKMIQQEAFRCKEITAAPAGVQPLRRTPARGDQPERVDPIGAGRDPAFAEPQGQNHSVRPVGPGDRLGQCPGDQVGGAQPGGQRPGQHGRRRHPGDRSA